MASIVNPAQGSEALFPAFLTHQCAYCRSSIVAGQRWVREKIFESITANDARYRRYHADLFGEEALSCWEKHQLELETAKTSNRPA